ncbi:MAG: hypothetical protein H0U60_13210 [Blastocatellia bacterium]|nr:hypothetical protein [Blastocatellia bacterium]
MRAIEDMPAAGRYRIYRRIRLDSALADLDQGLRERGEPYSEYDNLLDALLVFEANLNDHEYDWTLIAVDAGLAELQARIDKLREFAATL